MGEITRAELTPFKVKLHQVTPHIWNPLIKTFHLSIYMWGVTCDLGVNVRCPAPLTTQVPTTSIYSLAREWCSGLEAGTSKHVLGVNEMAWCLPYFLLNMTES